MDFGIGQPLGMTMHDGGIKLPGTESLHLSGEISGSEAGEYGCAADAVSVSTVTGGT